MFKISDFLTFLAVCLFAFSSCTKENIDTTTTTEDETPVEVVECEDFSILLVEDGGTIGIEVIGGNAPYTYAWSTEEDTNSITVEESGVYSVTVSDAVGCDVTEEITVEIDNTDDCAGFNANITHDGAGQLTAEVSGGTAPYAYAWSTGDNTAELSVDSDGVYSLTVTDALGCVVTDEIGVNLNPGECDNILSLSADTNTAIDFLAESEAHLWKGSSCDIVGTSSYDHNYIVVDVNWDNWGTGEDYHIIAISDGLPGISFGSNGMPQVGDVLSPYFVGDDYFYHEAEPANYDLDNIQVTITETSNELGGQIAGTISGTIANQNDEGDSAAVSGSFCVTIASVCE